ncbi:50S ribosomal protein L3 [Candidatus Kaiserbacteria bacterium RIFCSPHIGHO2_02_FULL_49_34]|uniref:50S ribosomal protein L3 n=1 Tax=Candidatus Kaiserbacteria bacterium RIFCSPHIGHO2_02_FULL_49_34 TaxID=1798491 RepID=A0A1F6DJR1_9BACT|nr:MAG: 50S ribosomal protein L3 [Candidatus Kaiserbacteria bacterium RIFCSPHIGHO2_02_FULL_49_34]
MMKYVLGTKERMTQVFDANGVVTPATVIHVTPHVVTAVKTVATDGYEAVQVATREQKSQRVAKAQQTLVGGTKKFIQEMRPRTGKDESIEGFATGDTFDASAFAVGDTIAVSAISKGKGFQGVVKRHGFHGDVSSHGRKRSHRSPGSIGATGLGRVIKGMRMAGRMGGDRITVKNLTVVQVNAAEGILVVSGAVPGHKGTLVEVRAI